MTINEKNEIKHTQQMGIPNIRWPLMVYDLIVFAAAVVLLLILYRGSDRLSPTGLAQQVGLFWTVHFSARFVGKVYRQVWRYGGIQCYFGLLITDAAAFILCVLLELLLPRRTYHICQNAIPGLLEPVGGHWRCVWCIAMPSARP